MNDDEIVINFPKKYKNLPEGYKVIYLMTIEHYLAVNSDDSKVEFESPMFCCRFMARQWCFNHSKNK